MRSFLFLLGFLALAVPGMAGAVAPTATPFGSVPFEVGQVQAPGVVDTSNQVTRPISATNPMPVSTVGALSVTSNPAIPTVVPTAVTTALSVSSTQIYTSDGTTKSLAIQNLSGTLQVFIGYVTGVTTANASYVISPYGLLIIRPEEGATFSLWGISSSGTPSVTVTAVKN